MKTILKSWTFWNCWHNIHRSANDNLTGARSIRKDKGLFLISIKGQKPVAHFKEKHTSGKRYNIPQSNTAVTLKYIPTVDTQSITLYPVPFDLNKDDATKIISNHLKAGTVKECKMVTHKSKNNVISNIKNGFVHLKIENIIRKNLPDSILINKRRVTILKPGQFLMKPCGFCQIRTQKQDQYPHQPQYVQPKNAPLANDFQALSTKRSNDPTSEPRDCPKTKQTQ